MRQAGVQGALGGRPWKCLGLRVEVQGLRRVSEGEVLKP